VPGQPQIIDAAGSATSIPDNQAGAVQPSMYRQDMRSVNADKLGTLAEAESGLTREKNRKVQDSLGDPAQLRASPSNVQSGSRVVADNPPVASDGTAAASDIAVADGAPVPRQDYTAVPGQPQIIDAAGSATSMPDNQAGAMQPGLSRQDANAAKTDQPTAPAPVPSGFSAQPPTLTLQTSRGLGKGLALEMRKSIEDGREHMRVRLDPKDLGQLDVRLSFEKDGALRAIITASTSASNDLLRQEMPTLVRNLSDAGVRMDEGSLRFELQSGSGSGSGQRQPFQDERRPSSRNGSREDLRPEEDAVFGTRPWRARGQFDLRA
jgi:flagellar hook-length control protein FliK